MPVSPDDTSSLAPRADLDLLPLSEVLRVFDGLANDVEHPHGLEPEADLAGVGLGQKGEPVHDLGEALDFVELAEQALALNVVERLLAPRRLQLALHHRERGLEFVRRVEGELADALERLAEARRHAR